MSDRDAWTDHLTKQQQAASFKANKYGAKKKLVDGITFDSTKEANRYQELKLREKAGEIWRLELQTKFPLAVDCGESETELVGFYRADFTYIEGPGKGDLVVEDVKGVRTPLYRWKKKHFELQYGIRIREV